MNNKQPDAEHTNGRIIRVGPRITSAECRLDSHVLETTTTLSNDVTERILIDANDVCAVRTGPMPAPEGETGPMATTFYLRGGHSITVMGDHLDAIGRRVLDDPAAPSTSGQ